MHEAIQLAQQQCPTVTICCPSCDEVVSGFLNENFLYCECGQELKCYTEEDKEILLAWTQDSREEEPEVRVKSKKKSKKRKQETTSKVAVKKSKGSCAAARDYFKTVTKKFKKGKISRGQIIDHCINELGVNKGTAGTQWSKYKKENL